jgi:hypothetical protein
LAASVYELLVLEKFGKARGRPQKHQAFVAERMAFMRGVLQVTSAQAEEIEQLVSACLSYEHSERFTAADVYTKARALARRIEGPDLREWAESVIPPLVRAFEAAPREPNPLIDQVLNEDSHALDDGGDAVAAAAAASIAAAAATGGDEVPRNDPRWEALRQAALAELKPSPDELPPAAPVPPPMPAAPVPPPMPAAPPTPVPPPMPAAPPPPAVTLPSAPPPPPRPAMFSAPLPDPKPQPFLEPDLDDWADIPTRMELDPSLSAPPPSPPPPPAAPTPPPAVAAPPAPAPIVATPADHPSSTWPPASEDDEATLLARFDRDDLASTQIESMVPPAVSAATSDAWAEPVAPPAPPMSVWPPPQDEPSQQEDEAEEPPADDEQDYDDEPEAPAPSPRNNLLIYGLVGVIVFTLVFTIGLGVLFMGPLKEALQNKGIAVPTDGVVEAPTDPDEAKPDEAKPDEAEPTAPKADEAPAGPHITFRSLAEGTRKLNVNCGAASGKGAEVAHVEVAKADKCAVTAILEKGRLQAVITDAKEGEYRCFEGGESRCVR